MGSQLGADEVTLISVRRATHHLYSVFALLLSFYIFLFFVALNLKIPTLMLTVLASSTKHPQNAT
jgi:hypothetical protein